MKFVVDGGNKVVFGFFGYFVCGDIVVYWDEMWFVIFGFDIF